VQRKEEAKIRNSGKLGIVDEEVPTVFVFDMGGVTQLDLAGLDALCAAAEEIKASRRGRSIRFVNCRCEFHTIYSMAFTIQ